MKVSPDGRYATLTREGASDRRNGLVLLDLSDPAHPRIAEQYDEGLTGGVHNAFPTNDYAYALSAGEKFVILDVRDLENPRFVGEYRHPGGRIHDIHVHDGIAYASQWQDGVIVVDVGDGRWGGTPENPVFVLNVTTPGGATHTAFPYTSQSTGRFYVIAGDDPEIVAKYEVPEFGTHNYWVVDEHPVHRLLRGRDARGRHERGAARQSRHSGTRDRRLQAL